MKTFQLTFLMGSILLFTSCKDDSVEPTDLAGDWQSEEIYVNGKLQEDISKSTWLLLKKDSKFQKNYVIGTWSWGDSKLVLTPNDEQTLQPLQYEVSNLSDASLTLEITLTESEYGRDFEGVEADETITVTEKYRKK